MPERGTEGEMSPQARGPVLCMGSACVSILRALPEWFGIEESILQYERDIDELPTFVTAAGAEAVEFLTLRQHN